MKRRSLEVVHHHAEGLLVVVVTRMKWLSIDSFVSKLTFLQEEEETICPPPLLLSLTDLN